MRQPYQPWTMARAVESGRLLLEVEEVQKAFGPITVLEDVSFNVHEGDRIGLVGANGCGKSTLLDILSEGGQDLGEVRKVDGLRIAYVTQVRDIAEDLTIGAELERKPRQFKEIEEELRSIEAQMADPAFYDGEWQGVMDRYQELQATLTTSGGGDVSGHATAILRSLGLEHLDLTQSVSDLSGGERAKVALARSLVGVGAIDLLMLDEPTNHLDIETVEWLESYLVDYEGAMIIVSHDRFFMDKVCNRIVEIEGGESATYVGNYTESLRIKKAMRDSDEAALKTIEKKIDHTTQALQHMKRANKYDKSISSKHKMIEEMQKERKALKARMKSSPKPLHINIDAVEKSSKDMVEIKKGGLTYSGEETKIVYEGLDLEIRKGDRLGIVGPNGSGKTSLLKVVLGEQDLSEGELDVSPGVQTGYFHQDHRSLDFTNTCVDEIAAVAPKMEYGKIRGALGRFRIEKDSAHSKIGDLSGGQRARIAILKLLLEPTNLLLLDEPTNHLDLHSKHALEEALIGYSGSMLVVSHDRYFLDRVVTGILEVKDRTIIRHAGSYTDYLGRRG